MREIKFRAWDKESKKMRTEEFGFFIGSSNGLSYNGELECYHKFVLMQYTGLKDKNEKKIYEGDIVKYWFMGNDKKLRPANGSCVVVEWKNGKMYTGFNLTEKGASRVEIIGNIYKNKDLIK